MYKRQVLAGESSREEALRRYAAFSARHSRAFGLALRLQRLIPALPPRLLTLALRAFGRRRVIDRAFGWYLDQAHPSFASQARGQAATGSALEGAGAHAAPSHSLP